MCKLPNLNVSVCFLVKPHALIVVWCDMLLNSIVDTLIFAHSVCADGVCISICKALVCISSAFLFIVALINNI